MLYGGVDHPGYFDDGSNSIYHGLERDQVIAAWRSRYFDIGLPFSIAATAATMGWLWSLHRHGLAIAVPIIGTVLILVPNGGPMRILLFLLWAPALVLTVVPWQVIVVLLLGVATAAVRVRPARPHMGLQLAAVLIAISWQVIFAVFAADISHGTLG